MNISAFPVARLTDLVDGGLLGLLHLLGVQQRAAADAVEGRLPELRAVLAPLVREPPKFAKFSLQLLKIFGKLSHENVLNLTKPPMTREYKKWKNRSTNKNEQLLKIQHYIKVRLLHDRHIW